MMTARPLHTPWAGRHRPFTIAMAPLEEAAWLEVDDRRQADLARKAAIFHSAPDAFQAEAGTEAAQAEIEARITAHLSARGLGLGRAGEAPAGTPALVRAALMVQDDLVLMRRGDGGWRLAAAALCFPSSWSLTEKFGLPLDGLHADVPGWAGPMGRRVARIFDNLREGPPVWRLNWSLQFGDDLRMPRSKHDAPAPCGPMTSLSIRVERQTLRRLSSGDILFTIKVLLDPLSSLEAHPEGPRLAAAMVRQLEELSPDELAYKSLHRTRDRVIDRLRAIAGEAAVG